MVLTSRLSSLLVCVVLWLIQQVRLSNSLSSLTSVKVLTYSSISSQLTVLERVFLIQLFVQPIQDTLQDVLLTFHRNLSFVMLIVAKVRRFHLWKLRLSQMVQRQLSHLKIELQADMLLRQLRMLTVI